MKHDHARTKFIEIKRERCEACWACIDACPHDVLGKVDLWFHKHAHVDAADLCKGCAACVRACPHDAIIYTYQPAKKQPVTA